MTRVGTAPERAGAPGPTGPPLRERVRLALTLLGVPAGPDLIVPVYRIFHGGAIAPARLTGLRRDEERSFRSARQARPFHVCPALTGDLLAPARGLLTLSTWPLPARIIGPLSHRVDFLTAAIRLAGHLHPADPATGTAGGGADAPGAVDAAGLAALVWRFAANIPGAAASAATMSPVTVADAARAELRVHQTNDAAYREAAATRAAARLDGAERLFGSRLQTVPAAGSLAGAGP